MTVKTRYFVIISLLVLFIGVGTGLVAYYVGFPGSLFSPQTRARELAFIPEQAGLVASVDVHGVMSSDLRRRLKGLLPFEASGQRELAERTGIDLERDVDRVTAGIMRTAGSSAFGPLVLVSGRFDQTKIETLMGEAGAQQEDYQGRRMIVGGSSSPGNQFSLAFIEPGVVAVGSLALVRTAIDLAAGRAPDIARPVTANDELMKLVRTFDNHDAWAVGRFDALTSQTLLPPGLAGQLPPITWFAAGARINGGINGTLQVETADEQAANNFREVIRGFVALARMQGGSHPSINAFLNSLVLGGTGRTVSLGFDAPAQLFESLPPAGMSPNARPPLRTP